MWQDLYEVRVPMAKVYRKPNVGLVGLWKGLKIEWLFVKGVDNYAVYCGERRRLEWKLYQLLL